MSNQEIYESLNEIFRNVFMDESIEVKPETTAADIEDWDSLMHIVLLAEIEKEFGFKFEAKEASGKRNVGELVEVILRKI